jgi:hypothetical protein
MSQREITLLQSLAAHFDAISKCYWELSEVRHSLGEANDALYADIDNEMRCLRYRLEGYPMPDLEDMDEEVS